MSSPAPVAYSASSPGRSRAFNEIFTGIWLVALMMGLIGLRGDIVRLWPRMATVYAGLGLPVNLRGLTLEDFHTVTTADGNQTTLGVEGEIKNLRLKAIQIPPIELAIRDGEGRILYSWQVTAPKRSLAAHESFAFRARLAAPPAGGQDVVVRFSPAPALTLASVWRKAIGHF